jgi:hypothetical protein
MFGEDAWAWLVHGTHAVRSCANVHQHEFRVVGQPTIADPCPVTADPVATTERNKLCIGRSIISGTKTKARGLAQASS